MAHQCHLCDKILKSRKNLESHISRCKTRKSNKCVDLFAGTGAFSQVLDGYGIKCVLANDMVEPSKSIYEANHEDGQSNFLLKDITELDVDDVPYHEILCAGFPCQPFSIAGKREGFKDPRSNVFWKIIEILEKRQPDFIILENVKNLTTHDNGNTFEIIKKSLEDAGYNLKFKVLDTCKITKIPHHRERIYIVGIRNKEIFDKFDLNFDEIQCKNISKYLEKNPIPDKYYYTDRFKVYDMVKEGITKHINTNTVYQLRRQYVRENKSGVCPTLTANMGSGGHNVPLIMDDKGIRKLTPRECFNLQGFPKNYVLPTNLSDSALYKLAGNAVSVPVVGLITERLFDIFNATIK